MKYKLIAVDIDDTLLNRKKEISPITKAALLQAQENGVKVAVASGRLPYGVRPFLSEERRQKLDRAKRLIKVMKLMPLLKDLPLFDL